MEIPKGLCQCGCGEKTGIASQTDRKRGWIKGEPLLFVKHHHSRLQDKTVWEEPAPCECGCGQLTSIAKRNNKRYGWIKGKPLRFVMGHAVRTFTPEFHKELANKRRGIPCSIDRKIAQIRTKTGKDPVFSPYIPGLAISQSRKKCGRTADKHRWYCFNPRTGKQSLHSRAVWEYFNGPAPEGYHVHHVNGKCTSLEDDSPDNLMIVSAEWNRTFFPTLSKGFQVPEEKVTEIYREVFPTVPVDRVFREVVKKLLTITQD